VKNVSMVPGPDEQRELLIQDCALLEVRGR